MTPTALTAALKEEALRVGFDMAGAAAAMTPPGIDHFRRWIADGCFGQMSYMAARGEAFKHPLHVLEGVRSILMLAAGYRTVEPQAAAAGQGIVSRSAWGDDYHDVLRDRLHRLADFHRRLSPTAAVRGVVNTAPLLERRFGQLAGLGWIGKNTMLVNARLGSWFVLGALLTTEVLEYDQPTDRGHCGTCRACIDACPTGALAEPYRLDARRCISYLTIEFVRPCAEDLRPLCGGRIFGCDACQEACPWNRRASTSGQPRFQPRPGCNPVELAGLLGLDEEAFRARFRGSPLRRSKRRGLLRNAAIALGNRPDPAALPALIRGLDDPEPAIRAACAWALGRFRGEEAQER